MNACFFIGHRDAPERLLGRLEQAVEHHITVYGVRDFYVGHYGDFDRLAARAVLGAKQRYSDVTLTLLLPYHPSEHPISVPSGFDGSFYPPDMESIPRKAAIVRANHWMIDHCTHLICYVRYPGSNSCELLAYAQRQEDKGLLHIQNLFP